MSNVSFKLFLDQTIIMTTSVSKLSKAHRKLLFSNSVRALVLLSLNYDCAVRSFCRCVHFKLSNKSGILAHAGDPIFKWWVSHSVWQIWIHAITCAEGSIFRQMGKHVLDSLASQFSGQHLLLEGKDRVDNATVCSSCTVLKKWKQMNLKFWLF